MQSWNTPSENTGIWQLPKYLVLLNILYVDNTVLIFALIGDIWKFSSIWWANKPSLRLGWKEVEVRNISTGSVFNSEFSPY